MFLSAKPIFINGRSKEMNLTAGFRAVIEIKGGEKVTVRAAASSLYRLFVNGKLVSHGPVRAAHGYFRVDEPDLSDCVRVGYNCLVFEVAGYNCNSFYLLDQPSFLQAECAVNGVIAAATGVSGFEAAVLSERKQKVQRYSYQRTFVESYNLTSGCFDWRTDPEICLPETQIEILPEKQLIARGIEPYRFTDIFPSETLLVGNVRVADAPLKNYHPRYLEPKAHGLKGFHYEKEPRCLSDFVLSFETEGLKRAEWEKPLLLKPGCCAVFDFEKIKTGFIHLNLRCKERVELYITFDEILSDGDVDPARLDTCNAVSLELEPGEYNFLSMEPYTLQYMKFTVLSSSVTLERVALTLFETSDTICAECKTDDPRLSAVFDAAADTFRQNALDIFMDCPSRERAGWLCDSFFTGRAERKLTGKAKIERNFLENYLMAPDFAELPDGMLPMCYPSDILENSYIPNWAMWLVLELKEYYEFTGDKAMADAFRPKIERLIGYFNRFVNEYGLIEKLEGWVFVEWSKAADFVQDVNFPSNMLFSAVLDAAGTLYDVPEWKSRARKMKKVIRELSLKTEPESGKQFFADHALRNAEGLTVADDFTEVCQYYAFYFGIADTKSDFELWERLVNEFGPERVQNGKYPAVYTANSFIGNYLRLDLLYSEGLKEQLNREILGYFYKMAEQTGTLWENSHSYASCCHGFTSYLVCWIC